MIIKITRWGPTGIKHIELKLVPEQDRYFDFWCGGQWFGSRTLKAAYNMMKGI